MVRGGPPNFLCLKPAETCCFGCLSVEQAVQAICLFLIIQGLATMFSIFSVREIGDASHHLTPLSILFFINFFGCVIRTGKTNFPIKALTLFFALFFSRELITFFGFKV